MGIPRACKWKSDDNPKFLPPITCVLVIEHRWPGLASSTFNTLGHLASLTIRHFITNFIVVKSRNLYCVRNSIERLNNNEVNIPKLK